MEAVSDMKIVHQIKITDGDIWLWNEIKMYKIKNNKNDLNEVVLELLEKGLKK
jgi:hypothetical protein